MGGAHPFSRGPRRAADTSPRILQRLEGRERSGRMDAYTGDDEVYSDMVKLVSREGHTFHVERKCAMVSGTIKAMLSGQFVESSGEITFQELSTPILEKVIQYMYYKVRYTNSDTRMPDFPIEPEHVLELLMAANFLDC